MVTWRAQTRDDRGARLYRLSQDGAPLTFRALFELLGDNPDFADWYTQTLVDCGLDAYFWEHPPMTVNSFTDEAEFALLPAPALAALSAEPAPFAAHFARCPDREVIAFENLGGDALLIAPRPAGPREGYPHLGGFLRTAPRAQVHALWRQTARVVMQNLGEAPRWLSTSGLGVAWLHLRLDRQPKYYQYTPFRTA